MFYHVIVGESEAWRDCWLSMVIESSIVVKVIGSRLIQSQFMGFNFDTANPPNPSAMIGH